MKLRIFVYKITFHEVPNFYYGWHKEKSCNDEYMGSPKYYKKFWELFTPVREIILEFEYSDIGATQAQILEKYLIKSSWDNPDSLNMSCGGMIHPEALAETARNRWKDSNYREKHSSMMKDFWGDPEFRNRMIGRDKKKSNDLKQLWEDPEYRNRMIKMSRTSWEDPDRMGKHKNYMKDKWQEPEFRSKISLSKKLSWQEPGRREQIKQRMENQWRDPEYREKISKSGEKWMWITDGTPEGTYKVLKISEIPEGYRRGRTVKPRKNTQAKQKTNNGPQEQFD